METVDLRKHNFVFWLLKVRDFLDGALWSVVLWGLEVYEKEREGKMMLGGLSAETMRMIYTQSSDTRMGKLLGFKNKNKKLPFT